MSSALINLSMVAGVICGIFSLITGVSRGVPVWTVLFRSAIVLSVSTIIVMAFFRYFNMVLFRFLAQKIKEHREKDAEEQNGGEATE